MIQKMFKWIFNKVVFYVLLPLIRVVNKLTFKKKSKRILCVSLFWIGDVLFTTPAIHALKKVYKDYEIDIWVNKSGEAIVKHNSDIANVFIDPVKQTKVNSLSTLVIKLKSNFKTIVKLWKNNYEFVFDFTGNFESMFFCNIVSKKHVYGILRDKTFENAYYRYVVEKEKSRHVIFLNMALLALIGVADNSLSRKTHFNIPHDILTETEKKYKGKNQKIISIAPFAGWSTKEWPLKYFVELALQLAEEYSCFIYLLGSPAEKERIAEFEPFNNTKIISLMGETSLLESAAVIKHSDLFIGLDSSQAHIAEALSIKSIVIFGMTNPLFSAPENNKLHKVVYKKVSCSAADNKQYCADNHYFFKCPNSLKCLNSVTVEEVFELSKSIIDD